MQPEYLKKPIRSFVIRGGRITDGQKAAFDRWWPAYGLSLHDGLVDLRSVFQKSQPVVLEIGFGMGDSLFEMARENPQQNFLGIEVHPPGVGRLISCAGKEGLDNLKVFIADANDVLQHCIAKDSISRVQLYFPDPWHKKKHNKRRIVSDEFLDSVSRVLSVDGTFHMATDWLPYAEIVMEQLSARHDFSNRSGEYIFASRPDYRPITKFERRGEKLGHDVRDLIFVKK